MDPTTFGSNPNEPPRYEGNTGSPSLRVPDRPANFESKEPRAERLRRQTAGALEKAAAKLHEFGRNAEHGDRIALWSDRAGGGADRAASYLRQRSVHEISRDARGWLRENPGTALAGSAAIGFLMGLVLRRR